MPHSLPKDALLTLRVSGVSLPMPPFWRDYSSTHSKIFFWEGGKDGWFAFRSRENYTLKAPQRSDLIAAGPWRRELQSRNWRDVKSGTFCIFFGVLLSLFVYFLNIFPFDRAETCLQTTCGRVCVRRCTHATGLVCPSVWRRGRERERRGTEHLRVFCDIPLKSLWFSPVPTKKDFRHVLSYCLNMVLSWDARLFQEGLGLNVV